MQFEALKAGPEIDDVALDTAGRIKAAKDVLVELDGEGAALGLAVLLVDGTGAAALTAAAFQVRHLAQVLEHALERELALDMGEVDPHTPAGGAAVVL